jgi:hypothetical protein
MRSPARFIRKAFTVDAIRVDEHNVVTVAKWCGGKATFNQFVTLKTILPNFGGRGIANPGDWVVRTNKGFKVYNHKQFCDTFKPMQTTSQKFEEIQRIVREVMSKQDTATYLGRSHDTDGLAGEATNRILNIAL